MKATKYLSILLIFLSCANEDCCDEIQELRTQLESTKSIRSFNDYIPEAPKYKEANWRVLDIKTPSSGCYISEKTDTVYILNYPDWEAELLKFCKYYRFKV